MSKTSPITSYVSRLTPHVSHFNLDFLISLFLFLGSLYAYTKTLAPTVLEGDAALFQYTPYVLGVTYPTGFPLYILLGKVWLTLFPFGEIAWRMNFFSAFCSAAALPFIYNTTRRLLVPPSEKKAGQEPSARWAALVAGLTFATLPTFWRWSTEAKTYSLNILLFSLTLYLLTVALEKQIWPTKMQVKNPLRATGLKPKSPSRLTFHNSPLFIPAFLLGLQISVHNTAVLLIPGLFLLAWLHFRKYLSSKKSLIVHLLLLVTPILFYLYIPLRAESLIAHYSRSKAIERGLLADFYHSGLGGLIRYFTATDFTGGIVTNWSLVPQQFFTDYIPILTNNLTLLGTGLGMVGGLALAILRPRIFWPLFLIYAIPVPFVLTYGQGEQSAFLLPSFLIFSIFVGNTLTLVDRLLTNIPTNQSQAIPYASRFAPFLLFLAFTLALFLPQTRYNFNWLDAKWSRAIYDEWADALNHPLEPEAAVLAHWGDLTPFWYMQYAESRRPDLRGLYPPTEKVVMDWYARGGSDLYIAGPLQGWAAGIEERYQLLPWGRLVRIAPHHIDPQSLLPTLPHVIEATFDNRLRLIGADYPPQNVDGSDYAITLTWQALAELPPETTISLRLSQDEVIIAQQDDTLLSGWFPSDTLLAGQHVLSYIPISIPKGTLPGQYRLQLVAYTNYKQPWALTNGATLLDLGEVEIILPTSGDQLAPIGTAAFNTIPGHDFDGELELADYEYSVSRVGQGKGFGIKLLWQASTKPADNYTLLVEAVDTAGNVIRAVEHQPVGGRAPTATWQAGQFVRDQVDLVLPASTPVGQSALRVRLSWLRPDGSKLNVRRWLLPVGDSLNLDWLTVTEKKGRVFEMPDVRYPVDANLENKTRLIGYNTSLPESSLKSGLLPEFEVSQADCAAELEACQIHFDFFWEGLNEMEKLYLIFFHVIDAQGQIMTQQDRAPGRRGKEPTTGWLPGEIVTDPINLRLSPNIAPGQYTIRLGMYLPPDGPRLLILDDVDQVKADFVEVGVIEVTP